MDIDIENEINKKRWERWRAKQDKEREKSYFSAGVRLGVSVLAVGIAILFPELILTSVYIASEVVNLIVREEPEVGKIYLRGHVSIIWQ